MIVGGAGIGSARMSLARLVLGAIVPTAGSHTGKGGEDSVTAAAATQGPGHQGGWPKTVPRRCHR